MQSKCVESEERRRVEGTRLQSSCFEKEKRRVEGTSMQRSC